MAPVMLRAPLAAEVVSFPGLGDAPPIMLTVQLAAAAVAQTSKSLHVVLHSAASSGANSLCYRHERMAICVFNAAATRGPSAACTGGEDLATAALRTARGCVASRQTRAPPACS
eukprot:scaffold1785_cov247-Pinguiococcus_pyrenoidosus.AAC.29